MEDTLDQPEASIRESFLSLKHSESERMRADGQSYALEDRVRQVETAGG